MPVEPARPVSLGSVTSFDDERGLGVVLAEDGRELVFHCTEIAGGSRHVDVGARVAFLVAAAARGSHEAVAVTPLPDRPAGA